MEIPLSELIDRMTVLRIKIQNTENPNVKKELDLVEGALKNFEEENSKIDENLIDNLQIINKELWDLVAELSDAKKENKSLEEIGRIYIRQHIANKKRIQIKNKIAEESGSGFKDIKVNSNFS
ncbi:MAG: hypothetical protein Q7S56_02520 [Nanoarchaeota archaeon]|nr:hypothetical protein [Nanoarchaeota archaeon]